MGSLPDKTGYFQTHDAAQRNPARLVRSIEDVNMCGLSSKVISETTLDDEAGAGAGPFHVILGICG